MSSDLPVIVIGAGAAGLAVAKELKCNAVPFQVFEAHDEIGGLWNRGNDGSPAYLNLVTNSSKSTTYLDKRAPAAWPSYFSQQSALKYLDDFAKRYQLESHIRFRCGVDRVESLGEDHWKISFQERGPGHRQSVEGRAIVVCTGLHRQQNGFIPDELLRAAAASEIGYIHSSAYRDNAPFTGKRVVVVGFGNSAADIATEVSEVAAETIVSTRSVPWIIPLWVLGLPADMIRKLTNRMRVPFAIQIKVFHLLQRIYVGHPDGFGLGAIEHDLLDRLPVSDRGIVKAIKTGRVRLRGPIRHITRTSVRFNGSGADEQHIDHLIFATGYNRVYPILGDDLVAPLADEKMAFPLLIFHPQDKSLLFTSEVNVPQGSWPIFASQAKAIVAYLKAAPRQGKNVLHFDRARKDYRYDLKGKLFRRADRFHVDPDIYTRRLQQFARWIAL